MLNISVVITRIYPYTYVITSTLMQRRSQWCTKHPFIGTKEESIKYLKILNKSAVATCIRLYTYVNTSILICTKKKKLLVHKTRIDQH